jgi:hypothetical protein
MGKKDITDECRTTVFNIAEALRPAAKTTAKSAIGRTAAKKDPLQSQNAKVQIDT